MERLDQYDVHHKWLFINVNYGFTNTFEDTKQAIRDFEKNCCDAVKYIVLSFLCIEIYL